MPLEEALRYCDRVVTDVSLDSVLSRCHEVHTMTSLVGFEAMMRRIRVYTYGMPFYAGWGLSIDAGSCERRRRKLRLDELVAATLLLYPRYLDPRTKRPCQVEETLEGLREERARMERSPVYRWSLRARSFLSRKTQLLLRSFV